jgi:Tfp pilus assembly protein PilF
MRSILLAFAAAALASGAAAQPAQPTPDKARDLFNAGKIDDALKELQAAHRANPKLQPPRVTLSVYFFQAKQGAVARLHLELAAAEDPRHPEVYLLNGQYALGEGRITDTILSCQTALQLAADPRWDPDQRKRFVREARLGLSSCYESRRDWAAAKEHLAALLAEDKKNAPLRQRLGVATFRLGNPDEAFAELRTAFQDDPAADVPEVVMARLHAGNNETAKAEEWLKKGVAAHPKSPKPVWAYANWLLENGRVDDAQAQSDEAAKLAATARDTLALKGLIARYKKQYAAAEPIFEGLHRDSPADPVSAWNLALALAESGDRNKVRRAVELADAEVKKNQRLPEGWAVLGWCLAKAERLDEAEKALETGARTGQLSRDARYFYAKVLADKKNYALALQLLKSAVESRGAFVYSAEANALLAVVEPLAPKEKK